MGTVNFGNDDYLAREDADRMRLPERVRDVRGEERRVQMTPDELLRTDGDAYLAKTAGEMQEIAGAFSNSGYRGDNGNAINNAPTSTPPAAASAAPAASAAASAGGNKEGVAFQMLHADGGSHLPAHVGAESAPSGQ